MIRIRQLLWILKGGIHTCDPENPKKFGAREKDPNDPEKNLVTPIEDIIQPCKHDQLTQLKGLPKIFIVQACSGDGIVHAAGNEQADGFHEDEDEEYFDLKTSLPIDADWFYAAAATHREYFDHVQHNNL